MSKWFTLWAALFGCFFLHAQTPLPCEIEGDNQRWASRFAMPGTSQTILAMASAPDGTLWATGSYGGRWGGDPELNGLVNWDGQRWRMVGGKFKCTSCGLGTRYALAVDADGNVYVGGSFEGAFNPDGSYVASQNLIKYLIQSDTWEPVAGGVSGRIYAIALDEDAQTLYIGGSVETVYTATDTTSVNNIANLDLQTGTWSDMDGGTSRTVTYVDGVVRAFELGKNNTLYVGGGFTKVNNTSVYSIAQWHPTNGWSSVGDGLPNSRVRSTVIEYGSVNSLAYDEANDVLYAGGNFGEFSGSASDQKDRSLARFQGGSWSLIPGIGVPRGFSSYNVKALAVRPSDGHLFVGGNFEEYNGLNSPLSNQIGEWSPQTQQWSKMNTAPGNGGTVNALVYEDGMLYVGGSFSKYANGQLCRNFLEWNGQQWSNAGDGLYQTSATIYDMVLEENGFLAAGDFSQIDNISTERLARWTEGAGWSDIPIDLYATSASNFNHLIYSLYQDGDWVYIGGLFGGINGSTLTNGIAAYNLQTGAFQTWGTGLDGSTPRIFHITKFQNDIYICGRFNGVNGIGATNIARLRNGSWESLGSVSGQVNRMHAIGDSLLVICGSFTRINDDSKMNRIACWDGTDWKALGQGIFNGNVQDMIYDEGTASLYVGGSFSRVRQENGDIKTANRLAIWKNGEWSDLNQWVDVTSFGNVARFYKEPSSGLIYVAGGFRQLEGQSVSRIFRFDPVSMAWGKLGNGIDWLNANSNANTTQFIGSRNGKLYLSGSFYSTGLNQSRGIATYDLEPYETALEEIELNLPDSLAACVSQELSAGFDDYTYQWSTNETTAQIEVSESGQYSLTITGDLACQSSDSVYVEIFPSPEIQFQGVDQDSIQACDSLSLAATQAFVEYSWNEGESSDPTYTVSNTGTVTLLAQDQNNCVGEKTVFVEIGESPDAFFSYELETATVRFSVSQNPTGSDYQWTFGDGQSSTEVEPTHTYTANGRYQVELIVESPECGSDTSQVEVVIDQLTNTREALALTGFYAQPNPTTNLLQLGWQLPEAKAIDVQLLDPLGQLVWNTTVGVQSNTDLTVDMSQFATGVYILRLQSADKTHSVRIVKQ